MSLDNIYPGAVQLFEVVVENGTVHFWDSNNTSIINIDVELETRPEDDVGNEWSDMQYPLTARVVTKIQGSRTKIYMLN